MATGSAGVWRLCPAGRPELSRCTISIGRTCRRGRTRSPRSKAQSRLAPSAPLSCSGWRTVLSLSRLADSMSSNPMTESSCGTRTPSRSAAASTPMAWVSEAAKIAVGGSGIASNSAAIASALAGSCGPSLVSDGSTPIPAAMSASYRPARRRSEDVQPTVAARPRRARSPMKPILAWPSASRCSATSRPPATSSMTVCGALRAARSTVTSGTLARRNDVK